VKNWNEERKIQNTKKNYISELRADIDSMDVQYKIIEDFNSQRLTTAKEVFQSLNSCKLENHQKKRFDELLLTFNSLNVLYQVRNTHEEMLSTNIYSEMENKKIKNLITEFYEQRDAMQHFIDEYRQDLGFAYTIVKKHITFGYDRNGETTVLYELSEICNNQEFKNAIFEAVKTREYILHMVTTLSRKLKAMSKMLAAETIKN